MWPIPMTKKSFAVPFAGNRKAQVRRLIAGPGVFICDSCIELCSSILADENPSANRSSGKKESSMVLPKPREIKAMLDEYVIGRTKPKWPFPWRYITTISACIMATKG